MSNQFAPNGVSFNQIKKDAKKIKKEGFLTHMEALNLATKNKTDFSTWSALDKFVENQGSTIAKLNVLNTHQVLYKEKNFLSVCLPPGAGKTFILLQILANSHKNYKKIAILNNEMAISALFMRIKSFKDKELEEKVTIYEDLKDIPSDVDFLIVDSFERSIVSVDTISYKYLKKLGIPVLTGIQASRSAPIIYLKNKKVLDDSGAVITLDEKGFNLESKYNQNVFIEKSVVFEKFTCRKV